MESVCVFSFGFSTWMYNIFINEAVQLSPCRDTFSGLRSAYQGQWSRLGVHLSDVCQQENVYVWQYIDEDRKIILLRQCVDQRSDALTVCYRCWQSKQER